MTYGGERADTRALDQLETILRLVTEELAGWRSRAPKEPRGAGSGGAASGAAGGAGRGDGELRGRVSDLESENKALRTRVEAARTRLGEVLARLNFLEEQARESAGGNGSAARAAAGSAAGPRGGGGVSGASEGR